MIGYDPFAGADDFAAISEYYLCDEASCVTELARMARLSRQDRKAIDVRAAAYATAIRSNSHAHRLLDAFLQEYGLSNAEGIALMRLSEALVRVPDRLTAQQLIRDKIAGMDWAAHAGKSPRWLVNGATAGLQLSAAWIKASGGVRARHFAARFGDRVLLQAVRIAMAFMGTQFILGRTIEEATRKAERDNRPRNRYSYDMLGEAARTAADAETYFQSYVHAARHLAMNAIEAETPEKAPGLSVKLSALHPRYEYVKRESCVPVLLDRMSHLARIAKAAGLQLTIDAEEADRLETSLIIIEALLRTPDLAGWDGLGFAVQAYQRRAIPVLTRLIETAKAQNRKITVRLVKGAYWDMEIKRAQELGLESYPVFTRKTHTDVSYLACARYLLDAPNWVYPQFATHNAQTAAAILEMAGEKKQFEFQRLHGMGEALHQHLIQDTGVASRVYAPVGNHKALLPYLVRRLLENGANSSFVNQLFDKGTPLDTVIADPLTLGERSDWQPDPRIGAPRNRFNGQRLAAMGRDLSQAHIALQTCQSVKSGDANYAAASLINGKSIPGQKVPIVNPAHFSHTIGHAENAAIACIDEAIAATEHASWADAFTPAQRAACLNKAADLLEQDMDGFVRLCVLEAGKTLADCVDEVREAVDFCRYYANQAQKPNIAARQPLGIVACISPWNFPLAIFLGQIAAALSVGNTVIAKPAPQTPLIACAAIKLLLRSGVPAEAIQLLIGDGPALGARLTAHPKTAAICFTGSTMTAKRITRTLAETGRPECPLIAETGGINVMIIDSTALLEQAVQDVIASAFQSAGQRCSACRIVAVQDDIADAFADMLAGGVDTLTLGDPADPATDIGPVIDAEAKSRIESYISEARQSFRVIAEKATGKHDATGYFIPPVIFEIDRIADVKQEVFGPVLHMIRFSGKAIDQLIDDINALGYGLTMGLHTRMDNRVHAIARHARVGNLYVNRNQIGAVVGVQPFGGDGLSGTGPKAGGPHYLFRLSRDPKLKLPQADTHAQTIKNEQIQDNIDDTIIKKIRHVQRRWTENTSREKRQNSLDQVFTQTTSLQSSQLHQLKIEQERSLPGPTGEDNTLRLVPRGILCCFPAREFANAAWQLALALYAGNAVIAVQTPEVSSHIHELKAGLVRNNLPSALLTLVTPKQANALINADIDGIIHDSVSPGNDDGIAASVCCRQGAIIPILTAADAPERFYSERTLTVNTTAAGGNASLLAMV